MNYVYEVYYTNSEGYDFDESSMAFFGECPSIDQLIALGLTKKLARKVFIEGKAEDGDTTYYILRHKVNDKLDVNPTRSVRWFDEIP